ncbi:hypothetical protein J7L36_00810 [bacterium]|nr:hypothetical protein [bacterium]
MKKYIPSKKQKNQIEGKSQPRRPKSKKEEAEFGPGFLDYLVCPKCHCVYFKKSWHHPFGKDYSKLEEKNLKFKICPACQMISGNKFEGELIIKNFPSVLLDSIRTLITRYSERAFLRDPMKRLISIKKIGDGCFRVTTTENQLAVRLGKKIKESFKNKAKVSISYSHMESTARVKVEFKC